MRYHPCLRESASTVSPGISTAESSAFGLRRLRTWVHVRATSTRPVSAPAGATTVPRRRGAASKGPRGRRLLAGRPAAPIAPSAGSRPGPPGWPEAPAPPEPTGAGRGRGPNGPARRGWAAPGRTRGTGWRCSGPVCHIRHSVCRTRSSLLLRTVVDQKLPTPPLGRAGGGRVSGPAIVEVSGHTAGEGRGQVGCHFDDLPPPRQARAFGRHSGRHAFFRRPPVGGLCGV